MHIAETPLVHTSVYAEWDIDTMLQVTLVMILTNATASLTTSVSLEDLIVSTRKDRITACVPMGPDMTIDITSAETSTNAMRIHIYATGSKKIQTVETGDLALNAYVKVAFSLFTTTV